MPRQASGTGVNSAKVPARSVTATDGTSLAEIRDTPRALTVKLTKSDAPEFARWLHENADAELNRLYEAWKSGRHRT